MPIPLAMSLGQSPLPAGILSSLNAIDQVSGNPVHGWDFSLALE